MTLGSRLLLIALLATTARAQCLGHSAVYPAPSCVAVLRACNASNGVFWLRPGSTTYQAFCGVDGWVLAMTIDGWSSTLAYSSPLWENDALLNDAALSPSQATNAKLAPFLDLPGDSVRLVMSIGTASGQPVVASPGPFTSLRALLAGGFHATTTARSDWFSLQPA